ncbi:MAG: MFS transporter [SAR86 cluster bacterium]|jgi:MFS transporter, OFA family, oxalate/formate antiporter|nr:MFS transporter [SAR86 cluster bacterium]
MISPVWPFRPSKIPFFYGWVIWIISTLGILFSIPGQTMGLAVFTESFIDVLGLTRTQLSLAYLAGTLGSALFLAKAGKWYDQLGGRVMISAASIALSLMILYISFIDIIRLTLGGPSFISFLLILIGYFGVRFFGQGILTSCSRNVLLLWFVKRRGLVSGARSVFVSLGFSLAPLLLASLIATYGWRESLWILSLLGGVGFSFLALIFIRDNPESCGLRADGSDSKSDEEFQLETPSQTLEQAKLNPIFWIYSLSLSMHAMFGTAIVFHIVAIFSEAGKTSSEAFSYFIPAAIFSTIANLCASWIADKISLKPILIIMLITFCFGSWGLINLELSWGFWLLAFGFGVGGGLWGVISNLAFIRFFGPRHLGEISGFSTSLTVFASAIGPAAFSLGYDYFGTYTMSAKICLVFLIFLLGAALLLNQKEDGQLDSN